MSRWKISDEWSMSANITLNVEIWKSDFDTTFFDVTYNQPHEKPFKVYIRKLIRLINELIFKWDRKQEEKPLKQQTLNED